VVHGFYYAFITQCLGRLISLPLGLSLFLALSIGIADEVHQLYLPGRSADILDLIADGLGITLSALTIRLSKRV